MGLIFIYTRASCPSTELRKLNIPFLFSDKKQTTGEDNNEGNHNTRQGMGR